MKAFKKIQLLLFAAFLFGVPIAAAGSELQRFSLVEGLKRAAIATAIILGLMIANFLLARLFVAWQRRDPSDDHA